MMLKQGAALRASHEELPWGVTSSSLSWVLTWAPFPEGMSGGFQRHQRTLGGTSVMAAESPTAFSNTLPGLGTRLAPFPGGWVLWFWAGRPAYGNRRAVSSSVGTMSCDLSDL